VNGQKKKFRRDAPDVSWFDHEFWKYFANRANLLVASSMDVCDRNG
jgi:hypothetical protein